MPFQHPMRPYTQENISTLSPNQSGVYGIFDNTVAIYIGSGDIRERMLAHFGGDNACINQNSPKQWTGAVVPGDPTPINSLRHVDPLLCLRST